VHVGAGWLAVGTFVPDSINWAELLSHAIVLCAGPCSTLACASVAEFFAGSSVSMIDSLVEALAFSNWDTMPGFLINSLAWQALASSNTFISAVVWFYVSTGQTAALTTLLVDLTSWAGDCAFSTYPVANDLSLQGTLASIGSHGGTLGISATREGADVLFAH